MEVLRDTNPMLQGGMNPVMRLGVIPGKAHPDIAYIRQCQANAEDPIVTSSCYPGGTKDINYDIMPGDIVLMRKCVRNPQVNAGEMNDLGIATLAGTELPAGYKMRWLEDQFSFVGVAVTECRQSDPFGNPRSQDPDSGFATIKVGTVSIINNNPDKPFYAGDLVRWRCPPRDDDYLRRVRQGVRAGGVPSQVKPEVEPFDYTDGTLSLEAAVSDMGLTRSQGGIRDIPFHEFVSRDGRGIDTEFTAYNPSQETSAALKYSVAGILLGAIEALGAGKSVADLKTLARKAFSTKEADAAEFSALVESIFAFDITYGQKAKGAMIHARSDEDQMQNKLRQTTGQFLTNLSHGVWAHKTSTIIGRALAYSAPGDTLHVMLGHTIIK